MKPEEGKDYNLGLWESGGIPTTTTFRFSRKEDLQGGSHYIFFHQFQSPPGTLEIFVPQSNWDEGKEDVKERNFKGRYFPHNSLSGRAT